MAPVYLVQCHGAVDSLWKYKSSLWVCRWYRKLCLFYKFVSNKHPQYIFNLIPVRRMLHSTRNTLSIFLLNTSHNFFKMIFFSSAIFEWNELDSGLEKAENLSIFKNNILKFIQPSPNSVVIFLKDLNLLQDLELI